MNLPAPSPEDALELLSDDQDEILELFDRYDVLVADGAPAAQRRELAEEICSLLAVHLEVKRDILYPAAREALGDESPVDEAVECQASIDATIADVQAGDSTEPRYDAGVRVLQELFVECIEQERTQLFPRLRDSSLDLEELGGELGAREELLLSAGDEAEPP
jgi:hypothetical protein